MQEASRNVIIGRAGGNASKNAKTYKVSIPKGMVEALGVTEEDKTVILREENGIITIKKA